MPRGMIVLWPFDIADIPLGWHLCDGTGGTVDMRGKFAIGAGGTYPVGATGGAVSHTHTGTAPHTHDHASGKDIADGEGYRRITESSLAPFTTAAADHLPPYIALHFIQKL